jgi:23S rRNA (uracil1939-C5)-methyltransferase
MENTLKKNDDYILDIVSYGYEGEGVGRIDNIPVFVSGALVGEKVKVKIVKTSKSHAFGKIIEVLESSQNRMEPKCKIYKRCGGCHLQHMSYEEQLDFKTQRVKDCIERIGKIKDVHINHTLGMDNPYRYRNKIQLPVGKAGQDYQIGFYALRSHDIINMTNCEIQDGVGDRIISLTRLWLMKYNISTYNVDGNAGDGLIRHIVVRKGFKTDEVMVILVTNGYEIPYVEEFIKLISENVYGIRSIIQNINTKDTNVVLGDENKILWGEDIISDYIGDFKFNISSHSFFQVNPIQTEVLYGKALEYANLTGEETVFDAYCGTGTISLFLSQKAKKVYGVEIVPQAIENAKINAAQNKVDNVEFIVGEAEKVIPTMINEGIKAQVVVVDPPRKGCGIELLNSIIKMSPDRIVYVSCDPSTLARDLAILEEGGFKTVEVQPVDMFPQTGHVETVVKLQRKHS